MTRNDQRRRPRAFAPDDPALKVSEPGETTTPAGFETVRGTDGSDTAPASGAGDMVAGGRASMADLKRGIGWGGLLFSALTGLFMLGAGAWFARLVSAALARDDIIGWTAYGLMIIAAVAAAALTVREIIGFSRLSRLTRIKSDVRRAIDANDVKTERAAVRRIRALYLGRDDLKWGLARFREHERDVHDAGGLMALAERELVAPLDVAARRTILTSAKRVGVVTAISPIFLFAILYVLVENIRMLRGLATLYGGRPGALGALRLGRMVITHIIATGGLAMTDDLIGQFLGQDLVRRLSRRLGEGVFNGALTARVGAAAIEVCRPLPFIEAKPIRVRDLVGEVIRLLRKGEGTSEETPPRSTRIDR
ncbi:MAG TPA: TIGR01620 family protein [Hyphomicrobiaceae bacterium]|nr:TIGR01620 family protein [Hyphomicrobiaceae bacterium]